MEEEYIPIDECCPFCDEYPHRIIKVTECNGGLLNDYQYKKKLIRNKNGEFEKYYKHWSFVKVLKSTTQVTHWLFKICGRYFVASQQNPWKSTDQVSIYYSDRRGKYDLQLPLAIYRYYVDLESAIDRFAQEYEAVLIDMRTEETRHIWEQVISKENETV